MKKEIEQNLKSIMPEDDSFDEFLKILSLPDEKFDAIYPQMKNVFAEAFKSSDFQSDVIRNAKAYSQLNDIDIEAEKAAVNELLEEIKNDDSMNENKKALLINVIESSALATYELLEIPRERVEVKIKVLPGGKIPTYAHPTDAGADVYASEPTTFEPHETKIVHTALQVAIPVGYEIQIRPRSGMSLKTGFRVANAPGTIDSDYRGNIGVIMTNTSDKPATIEKGDKIAQMVISEVPMIKWVETDNLDDTERGEGGFGSTDKS